MGTPDEQDAAGPPSSLSRWGLPAGIALFALCAAAPVFPPFEAAAQRMIATGSAALQPEQLAYSMQVVAGLFLLMIVWWVTEAIPLPATALLPAVILPAMHVTGAQGGSVAEFTPKAVLVHYANPVIFLFLGGFLIAAAMQRWRLDRRLTLWLLTRGRLAEDPRSILLGMMSATAFLSMWISNTACAAMMLPIGLGILALLGLKPGASRFGTAMMLGIAWAASIGGMGTVIGTPPNGIALGILDATLGGRPGYQPVTFLDWMAFGVPLVCILVPVAWALLLRLNPPEIDRIPGGREALERERAALGPVSRGERSVIGLFLFAVLLWTTNPFWGSILPPAVAHRLAWIDEYHIGLCAGALAFVIPVDWRAGRFVLTWKDAAAVDWGTLLLFGGGIALSDAMFRTGLAAWIATSFLSLAGAPSTLVLLIAIVLFVDFLTEVTSNTAVTSMIVPIVISIAVTSGRDPVALSVAAAVAASLAFMLPVATPPNALVFGTGYVPLRTMVRNGFALDIIGWIVAIVLLPFVGGVLLGILHF